jgi:hypothetical protein
MDFSNCRWNLVFSRRALGYFASVFPAASLQDPGTMQIAFDDRQQEEMQK